MLTYGPLEAALRPCGGPDTGGAVLGVVAGTYAGVTVSAHGLPSNRWVGASGPVGGAGQSASSTQFEQKTQPNQAALGGVGPHLGKEPEPA